MKGKIISLSLSFIDSFFFFGCGTLHSLSKVTAHSTVTSEVFLLISNLSNLNVTAKCVS